MAPKFKPNVEALNFESTISQALKNGKAGIENVVSVIKNSIDTLLFKITYQGQLKHKIAEKLKEVIPELKDQLVTSGINVCSLEMRNAKGNNFTTEEISLN